MDDVVVEIVIGVERLVVDREEVVSTSEGVKGDGFEDGTWAEKTSVDFDAFGEKGEEMSVTPELGTPWVVEDNIGWGWGRLGEVEVTCEEVGGGNTTIGVEGKGDELNAGVEIDGGGNGWSFVIKGREGEGGDKIGGAKGKEASFGGGGETRLGALSTSGEGGEARTELIDWGGARNNSGGGEANSLELGGNAVGGGGGADEDKEVGEGKVSEGGGGGGGGVELESRFSISDWEGGEIEELKPSVVGKELGVGAKSIVFLLIQQNNPFFSLFPINSHKNNSSIKPVWILAITMVRKSIPCSLFLTNSHKKSMNISLQITFLFSSTWC